MFPPNTTLQGRYRIIRLLSDKGGMGVVYLADTLHLKWPVVLKQIKRPNNNTGISDESLAAFHREAHLLAKLNHPALPPILDFFVEKDEHFLVMKYIQGSDLDESLNQQLTLTNQPFSWGQVSSWADRILDALKYLHTQSPPVIHRDIKPANIKLTERGEIFLLDFGLAKESKNNGLASSVWGYTEAYAPYEQLHDQGTDERSDLFSLAATLYHLLTGLLPPNASTRAQLLLNGQPDPLRPAHHINPHIPATVSLGLMKAMSLNSSERPADVNAFRAFIFTNGEFSNTNQKAAECTNEVATIVRLKPASNVVTQDTKLPVNRHRLIPEAHYLRAILITLEEGRGTSELLQKQLRLTSGQASLLLNQMVFDGILEPKNFNVQLNDEARANKLMVVKKRLSNRFAQPPTTTSASSVDRNDQVKSPPPPATQNQRYRINVAFTKSPVSSYFPAIARPTQQAQHWHRLKSYLHRGFKQLHLSLHPKIAIWNSTFQAFFHSPWPVVPREVKAFTYWASGFLLLLLQLFTERFGIIGEHVGNWINNNVGFIAYVPSTFLIWLAWFVWKPRKLSSPHMLTGYSLCWMTITCLLAVADLQGLKDTPSNQSLSRLLGQLLVGLAGDLGIVLILTIFLLIGIGIANPKHFRNGIQSVLSGATMIAKILWQLLRIKTKNTFTKVERKIAESHRSNLVSSDYIDGVSEDPFTDMNDLARLHSSSSFRERTPKRYE